MHSREEKLEAFGRFLDILDELRVKCPWDRKQTNESLRPNTIEEVYELCDALIQSDKKNICKELGDVLLHVAFYAKIGEENGDFDMADVCTQLSDKLVFRHPHVFGDAQAETAGQVSQNWEQIKLKEKENRSQVVSLFFVIILIIEILNFNFIFSLSTHYSFSKSKILFL